MTGARNVEVAMPHQQHVVIARLVDPPAPEILRTTLRSMRQRHAALGVTGVVLFDGESLLCLLEGHPEQVMAARGALATLPLAAEWRMLHEGDGGTGPAATDWQIGYADPDALSALVAAAAPEDSGSAACADGAIVSVVLQLLDASDRR